MVLAVPTPRDERAPHDIAIEGWTTSECQGMIGIHPGGCQVAENSTIERRRADDDVIVPRDLPLDILPRRGSSRDRMRRRDGSSENTRSPKAQGLHHLMVTGWYAQLQARSGYEHFATRVPAKYGRRGRNYWITL